MQVKRQTKSVFCARCLKRVPVVVVRLPYGIRYEGAYRECCAEFDQALSGGAGAKTATDPSRQMEKAG